MKKNKTFTIINLIAILFMVAVFLAVTVFYIVANNFNYNTRDVSVDFNDYWYNTATQSETSFPNEIHTDGVVEIINIIPNNVKNGDTIMFNSTFRSVKIFIDDVLLYDWGNSDQNAFGRKMTNDAVHFIQVTENQIGKEIKILLNTSNSDDYGIVRNVTIGSKTAIINHIFQKNIFDILAAVFLILLSLILVILHIKFNKKFDINYVKYLAALAFIFAFFSFFASQLLQFFVPNFSSSFIIKYALALIAPFFFLLYFLNVTKSKSIVGHVLLYSVVINFVVQFLLFAFNIFDFYGMMKYTRMFMIAVQIYTFVITFRIFRSDKSRYNLVYFAVTTITSILFIGDSLFLYLAQLYYTPAILIFTIVIYTSIMGALVLFKVFNEYQTNFKLKDELNKANNAILISQIRPHFLYNALNTIKALCTINPAVAETAIMDFATYLRANMGSIESKEPISFDQELQHIQSYLKIEKLRFGNRLTIVYDIKENNFLVPALSVEPLIENAVHHGIFKKKGNGTLTIRTYKDEYNFYVEVEDDGVGFDTKILANSERTGLKNTIHRLEVMINAAVKIKSELGKSTLVKITIPQKSTALNKTDNKNTKPAGLKFKIGKKENKK